jgi:hypothetical protein
MEEMGKYSPGDEVEITYDRNNKHYTTKARLLNIYGNTTIHTREANNDFEMFGAKFCIPTKDQLTKMNLKYGIEVIQTNNSFLSKLGIRNGFVITTIANQPAKHKDDLERLKNIKGKVIIEGYYKNNSRKYYYMLEL